MEALPGLWPASDLPGHCPDSMPACKHSKSGSTLDNKGSRSWTIEPLEVWPTPQCLTKSYVSQGEKNSIVKVKTWAAFLHEISLQPEIISRSSQSCNLNSHLWRGHCLGPFPNWDSRLLSFGTAQHCSSLGVGWPNLVRYTLLLLSIVSIFLLMIIHLN